MKKDGGVKFLQRSLTLFCLNFSHDVKSPIPDYLNLHFCHRETRVQSAILKRVVTLWRVLSELSDVRGVTSYHSRPLWRPAERVWPAALGTC